MNTLILTDCATPDHAYASAAALRVFPDADLRIANWRQVCDILEGPAHDYDTILLLSISLLFESTRAAMALNELREIGCKIHFFTDDPEFYLPAPLNALVKVHYDRQSPANALINHYNLSAKDLLIGSEECGRHFPEVCEYILAARARWRETHDVSTFCQTITALAEDGDPATWSLALQEQHRHWLRFAPQPMPGGSGAWLQLQQRIEQLLPIWWQESFAAVPILLQGEPGTPLRDLATKFQCPVILSLQCANASEALLAQTTVRADGAALLLEEIDRLPPKMQNMVLDLLETGRMEYGDSSHTIHVRLIATTHQELHTLVANGDFLMPLYQHLRACVLELPPLRERLEDLPEIAEELCRRRGIPVPSGAIDALQNYHFPGNEEELATLLETICLTPTEELQQLLKSRLQPRQAVRKANQAPETLESAMRLHVRTIVERCNGNKSLAAQRLGITRTTLRKYL